MQPARQEWCLCPVALWAGTGQLRAEDEEPAAQQKPNGSHASSVRPARGRSIPRRLSTPQDLGEATPPGVELLLDELGTRVAVAFADAADARQWLGLWCSACAATAVPPLVVGSGLLPSPQLGSRQPWCTLTRSRTLN